VETPSQTRIGNRDQVPRVDASGVLKAGGGKTGRRGHRQERGREKGGASFHYGIADATVQTSERTRGDLITVTIEGGWGGALSFLTEGSYDQEIWPNGGLTEEQTNVFSNESVAPGRQLPSKAERGGKFFQS